MSTRFDSDQLAERWEFAAALASRLAHDLSNIFTGVNGFTELAQLQLPDDHAARPYLRDVLQAGRRGIDLSQRLHLLRTCAAVQRGPAPIGPALSQAEETAKPRLPAGLVIEKSLPPGLPSVRLGVEPLHHTIVQLLLNAAEAAGEHGRVRIEANPVNITAADAATLMGRARPGAHVELRVIDNGPGISDEMLGRILQAPLATSRPGSRGLGLAIVFRVLYAHDSAFTLAQAPGQGTMARVCLPVA